MSKYRYTYSGTETINLPENSLTTDPNKPDKIYESQTPVVHPLFQLVTEKDQSKKGK